MITGVVTMYREAIVRLKLLGPSGLEHEIDALIDTGFDGWLTLPYSLIGMLGFPWRSRGRAILADGSESLFDIYRATVYWDGQTRDIDIDAVDSEPLLGMALLDGYDLNIQVRPGGKVTIKVDRSAAP